MFFKKIRKKKYNTLNIAQRLIKDYILPNKWSFLLAIVFMSLSSILVGYRAYLMKPAIDKIFVNKNIHQLFVIAGKMLVVGLSLCLINYVHAYILHKTNERIRYSLYERLFNNLIIKDIEYFKNRSSSTILSYFHDINGLMESIDLILNGLILQFLTLVVLISLMLYQNFTLSIISVCSFIFIVKPIVNISKNIKAIAAKRTDSLVSLYSDIGESFDNIQVIKSNGTEGFEIEGNKKTVEGLYHFSKKIFKHSLLAAPILEFTSSFSFALVLLYGGFNVIRGTSTAGEFFTFLTAMLSAYKPAKSFSGLNVKMQSAMIAASRIYSIIDNKPTIQEKEDAITLTKVKGDIEFKNVSYYYKLFDSKKDVVDTRFTLSKEAAVDNLNFVIKSGHSYALVGHSGSGKSTIFNLILRFFDPSYGCITLDGVNLRDLSFKTLRDNISLVSQDVKLFDASIYDNIRYAKQDATEEEIMLAAKMANVEEFAENMSGGYNSMIGPNGILLSGGQKQRISIARALLKNSPILLLDEATSALDPISEHLIQEALSKLMVNKTTIIIAHRLSTIINCDCIFVFEHGRLKEHGTHDELIHNNFIYKDLYDRQFNKKSKNKSA